MNENEESVRKLIRSNKRLFFIITYSMSPVYILILFVLQFSEEVLPYNYDNYFYLFSTNLSFIILIFGIVSALAIVFTYKYLIPYIQKCEDKSRILTLNLFLIVYGSTLIDVFGLIIGILGYSTYNVIDWFTIIPFIIVGSIYGIYLYRKVIPLSLEKYESLA